MTQREIKFRAWDNKKKQWLCGYELPNLGGFSLFGETVLLGEWSATMDKFLFSRDGYKPEDLVVMQFTGLKDKNEKEIYEGDIVSNDYHMRPRTKSAKDASPSTRRAIEWRNCRMGIGWNIGLSKHLVVIGNIYENPELLKP